VLRVMSSSDFGFAETAVDSGVPLLEAGVWILVSPWRGVPNAAIELGFYPGGVNL
jgi:hypothetical protein